MWDCFFSHFKGIFYIKGFFPNTPILEKAIHHYASDLHYNASVAKVESTLPFFHDVKINNTLSKLFYN